MTRPRPCAACGVKPIAYNGRNYCYDCVPRVWKRPARCKRCGSDTDYFTAGLCRRCHRFGPFIGSCLDCLAWGVTRHEKWLCQACRGWRRRYETGECPSCRRHVVINHRGYCRLCCSQATLLRRPHSRTDVVGLNRDGLQLFFADQILKKPNARARMAPQLVDRPPSWPTGYPESHRQGVLFDLPRNLTLKFPDPPLPELAAALDRAVGDHAARHGWSKATADSTRHGIHVLLARQDTPGAPIKASEASAVMAQLTHSNLQPVLEVLAATSMLDDDRQAPLEDWFATQTARLAEPMATEVRHWFHALRDGSTTPPRTRPRNIGTVRNQVAAVTGALRVWSDAGHDSLREITKQDILDVLPTVTYRRSHVVTGLRSLFRFLKARRMIFANPTATIGAEPHQRNIPLPIDLAPVRDAINSPNPAHAALAALIAFHAPSKAQVRALRLTDIHDGRMFLPDTTVVLAGPVQDRLAAWLDERARRWPHTANPHLFINRYTALRTCPVSSTWVSRTLGISARAIRQDRILHEALATGGDIRRLCDLFGLGVKGAQRYTHTTDQPEAFKSGIVDQRGVDLHIV